MPARIGPREAQLRALRERHHGEQKARAAPVLITATDPLITTAAPLITASPLSQPAIVINAAAPVINGAVTTSPAAKPNAQRQAEWRAAHPETARKRARDGMRKRRATAKA